MKKRDFLTIIFLLVGASICAQYSLPDIDSRWWVSVFVLPGITSLIAGNRAWIYSPIANIAYTAKLGLNAWSVGTFRSHNDTSIFYAFACIAIIIGHLIGLILGSIGAGRKPNEGNSVTSPVPSYSLFMSKFSNTREHCAVVFLVVGAWICAQFSIRTISPAWLLFMFVLPGYTSLIAGRRAWIYGPVANVVHFAMLWFYTASRGDIRTPSDKIAFWGLAGILFVAGEAVGLLIEAIWWLKKKKG
jgi:hypothetical protein